MHHGNFWNQPQVTTGRTAVFGTFNTDLSALEVCLSLTYIYKAAQKSVMTLVYSAPHIFVLLCFHIQNFFNMLKFIYYLLNKLIIELRDKYIILLLYY